MSKPKYKVGKIPLRFERPQEDADLRCINRALVRLDVTRHLNGSRLSRAEVKAWLTDHTYMRVSPFWRVQLDRFLELLPEREIRERDKFIVWRIWESLVHEWEAFLRYAVPSRQPQARTSLHLVVDNKPKPPAPKVTPRWRPPDDGPRAA